MFTIIGSCLYLYLYARIRARVYYSNIFLSSHRAFRYDDDDNNNIIIDTRFNEPENYDCIVYECGGVFFVLFSMQLVKTTKQ